MNSITNTLTSLANEAKAEEQKIVGKHRKPAKTPLSHHVHRTVVHVMHTGQLMWIGLPAILAFEAARPAWEKFIEVPLSSLMFGHPDSTHTEAISTITQHYFG